MRRRLVVAALGGCLLVPSTVTGALAQDNFYEGKTITILVGAKGGSLTVAAQLLGRHLGKYIPGNPTVINQQMPGGAHLIATNHVYNVAEPDGLTILAANPNIGMAQLAKVSSVRFDVRKFQWLGSSGADGAMFAIRADLPYKTFQEWKDSGKELVAGTTGPGSNAHDMPLLLKEFAGAPLRLVPGYPANSDILLALERKEVDAWSALSTTVLRAMNRGTVRPLVRTRTAVPGFENLPVDEDLATSELGKSLMRVRGIPLSIGRAYAVAPGVPAERVALLRQAFAKVMEDADFREEAKKAQITVNFIPAEKVAEDFAALLDQTPETLEAMGKYLKVGD